MVRPLKQGLDYFPMDVNFTSDVKVRRVRMACGMESVGILVYLLSLIYQDQGYYGQWDEELCFLTAMELHLTESLVEQVVQKAAQVGFFDAELLAEWGILTSAGIQERFLAATRKRKVRRLIQEYLLVDVTTEGKIELRSVGKKESESLAKAERNGETSAVEQSVPQTASLNQGTEWPTTESQSSAEESCVQSENLQSEPEYQDFDWAFLADPKPAIFQPETLGAIREETKAGSTPVAGKSYPEQKKPVAFHNEGNRYVQVQERKTIQKPPLPEESCQGKGQSQIPTQSKKDTTRTFPTPKAQPSSRITPERENWLANQRNRYLLAPERFTLDKRYAVTPDELEWIYDRAQ